MKIFIKKFAIIAVVALLFFALFVSANIGTINTLKVFNASNIVQTASRSVAGEDFAGVKFKVPNRVEFGQTVDVAQALSGDAGAQVIAPNGSIVLDGSSSNTSFVADQLGHYSLKVANYTYNIESYLKDQPILEVVYADDDLPLPTITKSSSVIKLPTMQVVTYDEQGERHLIATLDNGTDVQVIDDTGSVAVNTEDGTVQASPNNTTMFVRYQYQDTSNKIPYLSKEYTIKVQQNFENKDIPTLNVSSPSNGNVNVKLDIPKATGSDKYDKNLRYDITVTHNGNNVPMVTVDPDTGYANGTLAEEVKFDNDRNMSFYPTEAGEYILTYRATNSLGNSSEIMTFTVRVLDNSAPVFKKINDYKIPSQWGLQVQKANQTTLDTTDPVAVDPPTVYFPNPENEDLWIVDNLSQTGTVGNAPTDQKITVSMSLTNPQGDTILSFSDLYGNPEQTNSANVGALGSNESANLVLKDLKLRDGLNFNVYNQVILANNAKTIEGDYTLTYRARDAQNQVSTKTYKINLSRTFTDLIAPTISNSDIDDLPTFVVANSDLDMTLPNPIVSDNSSTRLNNTYNITDGAATYPLEGSEKLVYVQDTNNSANTGIYVTKLEKDQDIIDEGNLLATPTSGNIDDVKYTIGLTTIDSVGNYLQNPNNSNDLSPFTYTKDIDVVSAGWEAGTLNVTAVTTPTQSDSTIEVDDSNITFDQGDGNLVGFEVAVNKIANYDGTTFVPLATPEPVNNVALTTRLNDTTGTIDLTKMSFKPSTNGQYSIVIRGFDINGQNIITSKIQCITKIGSGGGWGSARVRDVSSIARAVELPTQIELGNEYKLPTYTHGSISDYYFTRTIEGGRFELVGDRFTPYANTTYTFDDKGYTSNGSGGYDESQLNDRPYYSSVTDTEAPTLRLAGDRNIAMYLPLTSANDDDEDDWNLDADGNNFITYILPQVIASNNNNNARVTTPTVTNTSVTNGTVTVNTLTLTPSDRGYYLSGGNGDDDITGYGFTPTQSGVYTVTYNAEANGQTGTLTFTIYIGNITSPSFTLKNATVTTRANGDSFDFEVVEADGDTDGTRFEYEKILNDPSHSEVARLSGEGTRDRINNGSSWTLDKSGQYEVIYRVTDPTNGITTERIDYITVTADSNNAPIPLAVISTILIVVGVVLILGAFVYLVRFRKVKVPNDGSHKSKIVTKTKSSVTKTTTTVENVKPNKTQEVEAVQSTTDLQAEQNVTEDSVETVEYNTPMDEVATTLEQGDSSNETDNN